MASGTLRVIPDQQVERTSALQRRPDCGRDLKTKEIERLREEAVALEREVTDLRASALRWRILYEGALRRCAERERELPEA